MKTIIVNGDDPKWKTLNKDDYYYLNSELTVADFPVKPGKRTVEYELLTFPDMTTGEIMEEIKKRGYRLPDRAETETILDVEDFGDPIVGLCGVRAGVEDGKLRKFVGYVGEYRSGRDCYRNNLHYRWYRNDRFLVLRQRVAELEPSDTGDKELGTLESMVQELEEWKKRVDKVLNV